MSRKKILIIVDHPGRDLSGIAYLAYELISKYRYLPIICGTGNEIRNLVLHKPDLLLISHLWFSRHAAVIDVAESMGVYIGILPTEGIADEPKNQPHTYGLKKHRHRIDLILAWNSGAKDYLVKGGYFPNADIKATGCIRFDFHTNKKLHPIL